MLLVVGRGLIVVVDVTETAGISTALLSPLVQTEPSQEEGGLEEEGGHDPNRGIDTE